MTKSNTPVKKTPAKRSPAKAKTPTSTGKHQRRLDRLTPEQRERVLKYASTLKGYDNEQKRDVRTPTPTRSLRPAIKFVYSAPAKMKSRKDPLLSAGDKSSSMRVISTAKRDPPPVSYAHLHLSEGVRRTSTKPTAVDSIKSFNPLPITRSTVAQDPPSCDANQMQIQEEKLPDPENGQLKKETRTSTFSELPYSGWNLFRRGLQAIIGLPEADENVTGNGASDGAAEEIFYDAVEFVPAQQHLVEDVSDEDEDICNLRKLASLNVPGAGESWIEPVDCPQKGSPRRFAKPDP